ncbi:MFS general substrate transporter [Butyriboletus roseoflavus]|nr:MFS general substrate transporter [Butyriboletus roseoflavus]
MLILSTTLSDRDSLTVPTPSSDSDNGRIQTTDVSKKDLQFWLIFASMCTCLFLSALELSSVSTALPTIAHELRASQFVWVGSAYALSSTAFLPVSGGLAQAFGRRPAILTSICLFALGSGICGGANSMHMLIAGRTVQGLGGGGIQSLTSIILADLVSLQERGVYVGLFGLAWCLAASIGPVVGGSLASQGQWRWLFYLNLPISLIASLSVVLFLDLPTPSGNYRDKLWRMDWIGNLLVIASTVAYTIGLTWGGTTAPWDSATVLVPFVLGLVCFIVFVAYEATLAAHPLVPLALMANATSVSGYVQSFCISLNTLAVVYFFPVYFQACRGVSPVLSGIYTLSLCAFAPAAILAGLSVKATGRYRPQLWVAWAIVLIAMGLLSAPTTDAMGTGIGTSVGYLVLLGFGTGALYVTTIYPIQAPLSVTQNAPALAWAWFLRSLAGVWGVTIGSAVLQNELSKTLPTSFIQSVPQVTANPTLYALIPELSTLPPYTRSEIQDAFARSLVALWRVLAVVCAVGGVASLFMKGLALSHTLDATWAVKHGEKDQDKEAAATRQME